MSIDQEITDIIVQYFIRLSAMKEAGEISATTAKKIAGHYLWMYKTVWSWK